MRDRIEVLSGRYGEEYSKKSAEMADRCRDESAIILTVDQERCMFRKRLAEDIIKDNAV